ncbi:MAG: molybdenum ABC transporter ATP-binding protein [Burkholderiaceae bacterium]|nr:molybdenum ABC transporter ATP-binding protein [Burkholderiaceae bacterium]
MIRFDAKARLGGFSLEVGFETPSGAVALFGPSGSGKSSVLGLMAGLLRPDSGRFSVGDDVLFDTANGVCLPAHRRGIGFVFQDALLFPHLSVRANLLYGTRFAGARASRPRLEAITGLLGIAALLDRMPGSLSGGERQRVAIGRALLSSPRLLLFDEPLASLDDERRLEILPYIETMQDELGVPFVYVSHALDEVARLATHVVVLERGRVSADGPPGELLAPAWGAGSQGRFSAVSVIDAVVRAHDEQYRVTTFDHPAGTISVPGIVGRIGASHRIVMRAIDVGLAVQRPRDVSFRTVLLGRISGIDRDAGALARVELALRGSGRLVALVTRISVDELGLDEGDDVFAMVKAVALDERALALAPRVRSRRFGRAG